MKNFQSFVIFGTVTFAFDYAFYLLFFKVGIETDIAKFSSSFLAVVLNYFLNSRYNFAKEYKMKAIFLIPYLGIYSVLIFVHTAINRFFLNFFHNLHLSVVLAMSISVFLNYFSVKYFFAAVKSKNEIT